LIEIYLNIPIESGLNSTYPFELYQFCNTYQLNTNTALGCLRELEHAGFIVMSDAVYIPSKLKMLMEKNELYNFQVKYQRFDNLIKLILRSYGGVFDYYVKINEFQLSKFLNTDKKTVINLLNELSKLGILEYLPASDTPRITFLHARSSDAAMYINPTTIKDRKNRFGVRADAFINYITSTTTCRSMIISSYFGEEDLVRCGTCDICREQNKLQLQKEEEETIINLVLSLLANDDLLPIEIYNSLPSNYKNKSTEIIRQMIEKNLVFYNHEEKLSLNKTKPE
jgi:ATP-dependent DNA helicase RecQ